MTQEEIKQIILKNYRKEREEKSKETGMDTIKSPLEQAEEKQEKRAKDRHKNLLKDYKM